MPDPLYSGRYTEAFVVTPSDTVPISSAPNGKRGCSGFHVIVAGNLVCKFRESPAIVSLPVGFGEFYPYNIDFMYIASTAQIVGLK